METILPQYFLFFLKLITIPLIVAVLFVVASRKKNMTDISVTNLSTEYEELQSKMLFEVQREPVKKEKKSKKTTKDDKKNKLFVLNFDGDVQASQVDSLRDEITAVLSIATPEDEVLLVLESHGGLVDAYGLAASQLKRLRDRNIPLTVAVDKVAASGGYMMACVANKIIATPFSYIGSIGVVATIPNIHRLLAKNDIDVETVTAGKYKRTVTLLGENTPEAKEKFQQELEETHELFKLLVETYRPQLTIDQVATGEVFFGVKALELQLVDDLLTSDEYILQAMAHKEIFEISYEKKETLLQKVGIQVEKSVEKIMTHILHQRPKKM